MLNLKQFEQSLTWGAPVAHPVERVPESLPQWSGLDFSPGICCMSSSLSPVTLQLSPSKIKQKSFIDYQNDCLIFCQPTNHLND